MRISTHEDASVLLASKGALIAADLVKGSNEKEKARRILGLEGVQRSPETERENTVKRASAQSAGNTAKLDAFRRQYYAQGKSHRPNAEEQQHIATKEKGRSEALAKAAATAAEAKDETMQIILCDKPPTKAEKQVPKVTGTIFEAQPQ
jgi:hypothetical protein